jgi:hypothetical protein
MTCSSVPEVARSKAERRLRFVAGLAPLDLRRSVGRLVAVDPLR